MIDNNPNTRQEPDFTNDRLTDMVLHKDDEPIVQNGEIINEPDDVEEKSFAPGETDVFPLKNNDNDSDSCWFPIHFSYNGTDHTADVHRIQTPLAEEYHVSAVTPAIDHLPEPFIVAEHFSREKFDFPVNETYYPPAFGDTIIKAIHDGAKEGERE